VTIFWSRKFLAAKRFVEDSTHHSRFASESPLPSSFLKYCFSLTKCGRLVSPSNPFRSKSCIIRTSEFRSSGASRAVGHALWFRADETPVFLAHIVVDFHRGVFAVKPIRAVSASPGNPKMLAGLDAVIVRFESGSFQALKTAALVIYRAPLFRECNVPNAGRSRRLKVPEAFDPAFALGRLTSRC
jgi:hypothetical protein